VVQSATAVSAPAIIVEKGATPESLPAPGGTFTFDVSVINIGVAPLTLTTLIDNVYGNLNGKGTCATGGTIAAGTSYTCSFSGTFSGMQGDTQTDTVTATAVNTGGSTAVDSDDAQVKIIDVPPVLGVTKAASPPTRPDPGGTFTFTVAVQNPSPEPVKITSLTDNIYGNLATRPGSTCGALIGTTLAPGAASAPCTFTGGFTGSAGAEQTDVVTANGIDSGGTTASATDDATVGITNVVPKILVDKDATPTRRSEPGGSFTYKVTVTNAGPANLTITSLVDSVYGNLSTQGTCTTSVGTVLSSGATYTCSFPGTFTGGGGNTLTDTVTATATDSNGTQVTDSADATVTITNATPTIQVIKTASPLTRPSPGGVFTFTTVVTNPGFEPVTLTSLGDSVVGDLNGKGSCAIGAVVAPNGGSYTCSFPGTFTGNAGDIETDVVTATAVDNEGTVVTDGDDAHVAITASSSPTIAVSKTAAPTSLKAPGGTFTYNVVITNTGPQQVTITSLVDNVYGDLATKGTCTNAIGIVLAASPGPGNTYNCSFQAPFTGSGGDSLTDRVTATAVDAFGNVASAFGDATVTIVDVPPQLLVTKTPLPPTLPEPGGNYVTSLMVKNIGGEDVTITKLTDSIYGDVTDHLGGCTIGVVIAPRDTYQCYFVTSFTGVKGATQTDTLTVIATDDHGSTSAISDTATVRIVDPLPEIDVQFSASPANRPAPGGFFTFTVAVRNTGKTAVTLAALLDDVDGYLGAKGSCPYTASIPVGATFTCTFADEFRGSPGDVQLRTVRAIVNNIDGNSAIDNDDALISLTGGPTNGPSAVVARDSGPALVVTGNPGTPSSGSGGAFTPPNVRSAPSGVAALSTAPAGARGAGSSGPAAAAIIGSARPGTSASAGTGVSAAAVPIPASASRSVVASAGGNLSGAGTAAAAMLMMGLSLIGAGQIWRRFHP